MRYEHLPLYVNDWRGNEPCIRITKRGREWLAHRKLQRAIADGTFWDEQPEPKEGE